MVMFEGACDSSSRVPPEEPCMHADGVGVFDLQALKAFGKPWNGWEGRAWQ